MEERLLIVDAVKIGSFSTAPFSFREQLREIGITKSERGTLDNQRSGDHSWTSNDEKSSRLLSHCKLRKEKSYDELLGPLIVNVLFNDIFNIERFVS